MGNLLSRAKIVLGAAFYVNSILNKLSSRLKESPGLPVANPSQSFWTVPKSGISSEGKTLPAHADIVVIGSGITGTSFAYNALKQDDSLRVVMLEARDVCSGATGRNGGHINPPLYHDYVDMKEVHGADVAQTVIRYRLAHLQEMKMVATAEDILEESQFREVEHFDVHFNAEKFAEARAGLVAWKKDMPEEASGWQVHEGEDAAKKFRLSNDMAGCIHGSGGAMHPYRFVTSLLSKLLACHPNFFIATHTPCTAIAPPTPSTPYYTLSTPHGTLTTPHIIHATNSHASHLLTPLRKTIIPFRGTMSAQRPGTSLHASTLAGARSFVFNSGQVGYDYLTQLPAGERELMFGGAWASGLADTSLVDVGNADDAGFSALVASHLAGALPYHFGKENWGREAEVSREAGEGGDGGEPEVKWTGGRTKAEWSGILGISADGRPWVGRLPVKVSGRAEPPADSAPSALSSPIEASMKEDVSAVGRGRVRTAPPGEWIAAGYSGEGMVHAWMSGKALACMVRGEEGQNLEWFPEILRVTEDRWRKASIEGLIVRMLS